MAEMDMGADTATEEQNEFLILQESLNRALEDGNESLNRALEDGNESLNRALEDGNKDVEEIGQMARQLRMLEEQERLLAMAGGANITVELVIINKTSEAGVLSSRSHEIFKEDLANNEEFQDIERQMDALRDQDMTQTPEFDELSERRSNIMAGTTLLANEQAEAELGFTREEASNEIGSGENLFEEYSGFKLSDGNDYYLNKALDAPLMDRDGNALSGETLDNIVEARSDLNDAMEKLEDLINSGADPATIEAADIEAGYAYQTLSDYQDQAKVAIDYSDYWDEVGSKQEASPTVEESDDIVQANPDELVLPADGLVSQGDPEILADLQALTGDDLNIEQPAVLPEEQPGFSNEADLSLGS